MLTYDQVCNQYVEMCNKYTSAWFWEQLGCKVQQGLYPDKVNYGRTVWVDGKWLLVGPVLVELDRFIQQGHHPVEALQLAWITAKV